VKFLKVNFIFPSKRIGIGISWTIKLKRDLEDKKETVKGLPLVFMNFERRNGKTTID
jgi:hypothetical protein